MTDLRAALAARARLIDGLRRALDRRGYLAVETPAVVESPGVDRHIDAPAVEWSTPAGSARRFLISSPEYHMKRLLAAGSGPIYQIGKVWRAGEHGALHRPEFTMLELYRPGIDHLELMDEIEELLREVALELGTGGLARRGSGQADLRRRFARTSVREAFRRHCGLELAGAQERELRAAAERLGLDPPAGADREQLYHLLMGLAIEPELGRETGEFLYDYPADQCALARIRSDPEFAVAERFEVYLLGIELGNGFHELTDPDQQRRRIEQENRARAAAGRETYPVDQDFLAALARMPPAAGIAIGVDRLAMLLLGRPDLGDPFGG
jgi:lysyl-tRNA synthetase class 2